MDDKELIKVFYRLRKFQKECSRGKQPDSIALQQCKKFEKQVDQELELRFESLFLGDK
jgi:TorA maturation chaperone TorD